MSAAEDTESGKIEPVRPTEILCQILQFAVGRDGIKALLSFTHVSTQWRHAALGDSSLWTTIHLKHTTPPLLDMILAHAGNRLFTVHVDHRDLNRLAKLWKLVDRIEELYYSTSLVQLAPFLSSLGPAPNLKVLSLRPKLTIGIGEPTASISLPTIFSGCLPLLRNLTLMHTVTWPIGLFRDLVSFQCYVFDRHPISPVHVLSVLRESPSITSLCLIGTHTLYQSQEFHPPPVTLPSLEICTLVGQAATSLIRFLTIPASTHMSLNKSYNGLVMFAQFDYLNVAPNLGVLDGVSDVSFFIGDHAVRLEATNIHYGVFDAKVDKLDLTLDPILLPFFIRSSFTCTCPGFNSTKTFTLDFKRSMMWKPKEATEFALDVTEFIFNHPSIEEVELRGVPSLELSLILKFPHNAAKFKLPCPRIRRLRIVSTPVRSPRPLLEELGKLLAERKEAGASFESVTVKAKCELLIPAAEHRAFLTTLGGLVGEGVSLEYEEAKVKKLPWCRCYGYDDEEDKDEEKEGGAGDPDDGCVGWDGWPENWPATVG